MKWSDKYFPQSLDEYVFSSEQDKAKIELWIQKNYLSDCLLFGVAGTGKTTFAKLIPRLLGISEFDMLFLDASQDFSKAFINTSLDRFIQGTTNRRVVVIDEADELSKAKQKTLMSLITKWSKFGISFIICANDGSKIDTPLHSRCAGRTFCTSTPDEVRFVKRLFDILDIEKIKYDNEDVLQVHDCFYPRLRDAIDHLEQWAMSGTLILPP